MPVLPAGQQQEVSYKAMEIGVSTADNVKL